MLDIERAEKFIAVLDQASAFPLFDASRRLVLSHDMAVVALEFAASVRMHGACRPLAWGGGMFALTV